ncbi:MAG: ribonuclease P protein component [Eubacteriales bacterium]
MIQNQYRMKKNSEFKKVFSSGKSFASKYVIVYISRGKTKFGFIASKKIGNAVKRNRAKRLMREALRLNYGKIKDGYQIIIIARANINGVCLCDVENSILYVMKKACILIKEK